MTDQKEAAVQRLARRYHGECRRFYGEAVSLDFCTLLARIAIEKGVVPAVQADRQAIMDALDNMEATGADSGSVDDLPWYAVCAEQQS